jgi:putative ABC transport system permease protein
VRKTNPLPALALFYRLIVRPLRQERLRTVLTVAAVALGVAAVVAIELAGQAAAGSFRSSLETLTDSSNLEVTAAGGIPAEVFASLATAPYPLKLHPRIEDYGVIAGTVKRTVPIVGIDVFSEQTLNPQASGAETPAPSDLDLSDSVWVTSGLGFKPGDAIHLLINDTESDFKVAGVLDGRAGEAVLMDLAPATRLFRREGKLDRILMEAPATRSMEGWMELLRKRLPEGVAIARQGTQTDENRHMLEAFRWNLRVLSYVSLAVGAFLIYNTISISVVRRRFEIGILRAMGTPRIAILAGFLGEAGCFGFVGGIGGLVLGRLMSEGAVNLVASTVANLYFSSRPAPITLTAGDILLGILMGIGIALLSALGPAWEASRVAPVEAMARGQREHHVRTHRWWTASAAAILALAAWAASRQDAVHGKPIFGYACALLSIVASALLLPLLVSGLAGLTTGLIRRLFGVEALLASRSLAGSLRRTSVLVGALSTAIAVLTAVGIMVGSFRETVVVWMDDVLQADLFLGPAVPPAADRHPTMSAEIPVELAKLPEVDAVDQLRTYEIRYQGQAATLGGMDARVAGRRRMRSFLSGAPAGPVFQQLRGSDSVIVSEPFANKHGTKKGDILKLSLGDKVGSFRVLDVYYDYSSERGVILMDRETLFRYLPGDEPNNVAVYLKPGISLDDGERAVDRVIAGRLVIVARNVDLRNQAIEIFDRTFAITYVLEALAVFVAVTGVGSALLALVIDRRREFGLLRFLGAADAQIRRVLLFEAGLLGILANIAGVTLGLILSLLLIHVINKQSFGWTIQFHWPVAVLLGALSVVYISTILSALYPARIAIRLVPIQVIHEE